MSSTTTLSTHARSFHVSREQRVNISEIVLFHKLRGEKATIILTAVLPILPRLKIMFLVCKYQEYKRQQQEVNKRKVTERELSHLNHKIVSTPHLADLFPFSLYFVLIKCVYMIALDQLLVKVDVM